MAAYVIEGPRSCGNLMGYYKENLIPKGKFAIVEDGEYANGGQGPCLVDNKLYSSWNKAMAGIADLDNVSEEDLQAASDYFDEILYRAGLI